MSFRSKFAPASGPLAHRNPFSLTMANDPNRDLLPVKEDNNYRTARGFGERIDHQILAKLSRCELEDRFLRLLDEQTHLKKLINGQEEKIKRLGTKLLRLIGDKKNGRKGSEQIKEAEDLHMRILELEQENYVLKDKNTVLKQQVGTHTRHISVQRSPVRSAHTSPLMSIRQSAPAVHSEVSYESGGKATEAQLKEAESHIKKLKEEIKSLHNKIDYLQRNLERNNLDNRKTKVTENIELIRLQRSLKQQAIQIAALQAQVKNSENNQKKLKEELVKAQNENEEALHLISVKQSEILILGSKLEEKNLDRLEEDELKQRINDLMLEREFLKERSDFLMKTISTKAEEDERVNDLKKLLAEEKQKKQKLEEALEASQNFLRNIQNVNKENSQPPVLLRETATRGQNFPPEVTLAKGREEPAWPAIRQDDNGDYLESLEDSNPPDFPQERFSPTFKSRKNNSLSPNYENKAGSPREREDRRRNDGSQSDGKHLAEKMKLERELQYMREMLRSQTSRCEAQQAEISRLMHELRVSDEKCNDTLRRLDMHLKIFQNMEMRSRQNEVGAREPEAVDERRSRSPRNEPVVEERKLWSPRNEPVAEERKSRSPRNEPSVEERMLWNPRNEPSVESEKLLSRAPSRESKRTVSETSRMSATPKTVQSTTPMRAEPAHSDVEIGKRSTEKQAKSRFVEQVFLESSDEEAENEKRFDRESFIRKIEELRSNKSLVATKAKDEKAAKYKGVRSHRKLDTPSSSSLKFTSDSRLQIRDQSTKKRHSRVPETPGGMTQAGENVVISILWFKLHPESSLWRNTNIHLLFVDFSFLDLYGEETETPESLPKPTDPRQKCEFNFSKVVTLKDSKLKILRSLSNKPDMDLIVFKVISDSEDFDQSIDFDCEELGVAVVTVKQFVESLNNGPFAIDVKNVSDTKEVVGTLGVKFDATPGVFSTKN